MKKRDEQIVSLHQSLHTQKDETERMKSSHDNWKDSRGLKSTEMRWHSDFSQLKELPAKTHR